MNKRNSRRIKNSLVAILFGWLASLSAFVAWLLILAIRVAIAEGISVITDGSSTILLVFFIAALLVSAIVTLVGWAMVEIPLALVISDRQIRKLWFMVLIHVAATVIATAILTLLLKLFENLGLGSILFSNLSDSLFVTGWAAITGAVGGWKFWALQRSR